MSSLPRAVLALVYSVSSLACTRLADLDDAALGEPAETGDGETGQTSDGDPGDGETGDGETGDGETGQTGDGETGDGETGETGDDDPGPDYVEYAEGLQALDVCVNEDRSCALRLDGTLACWGAAADIDPDQTYTTLSEWCGFGVTTAGEVEHVLGSLVDYGFDAPPYERVFSNGTNACATTADHAYDCYIPSTDEPGAEPVPEGPAAQFSFGFSTACLRRPTGEIACWTLFDDDVTPGCKAPDDAPPGQYQDLHVGCGVMHLVDDQGRVTGWDFAEGQLYPSDDFGLGNRKIRSTSDGYAVLQADGSIVRRSGQTLVEAVPGQYLDFSSHAGSGLGGHACAIRADDNRVVCWGYNFAGQAVPPQR